MKVDVIEASIEEKPILRNLIELCQHDYSEFNGEDAGESGLFGYSDRYVDLRVDDHAEPVIELRRIYNLRSGK